MRKIIAKLLILTVICSSLIGCQKKDDTVDSTAENTEIAKSTEIETEAPKFPVDVTGEFTEEEMHTVQSFLMGLSGLAFAENMEDFEADSSEVTDYQKELAYYFMMHINEFRSLNAFEDAGLLIESPDFLGYRVSAEQFEAAMQYIWKKGLSGEMEVDAFMSSYGFQSYGDGTYGIQYVYDGVSQVDKVVILQTAENTYNIVAKVQFKLGDGVDDKVFYIRAEAERNEQSPLAGMTVNKIMVSRKPATKITEVEGIEVLRTENKAWFKDTLQEWQKEYTKVLLEVLTETDGIDNSGTCYFELLDVNKDNIPELYLIRNDDIYMYTQEGFQCFVTGIKTDTNEVVAYANDDTADPTYVGTLKGNKFDVKMVYWDESNAESGVSEEERYRISYDSDYNCEPNSVEMISEQKYNELEEIYSSMDLQRIVGAELTLNNIEEYLHIEFNQEDEDDLTLKLVDGESFDQLEYAKIYLNDDDTPEYVVKKLWADNDEVTNLYIYMHSDDRYQMIKNFEFSNNNTVSYYERQGLMSDYAPWGSYENSTTIYKLNDDYELEIFIEFGKSFEDTEEGKIPTYYTSIIGDCTSEEYSELMKPYYDMVDLTSDEIEYTSISAMDLIVNNISLYDGK